MGDGEKAIAAQHASVERADPLGKKSEHQAGGELKTPMIGIPFMKDKFLTLYDSDEQNVMIMSVPIRTLAEDGGGDAMALLLGKMELFKGEAHKTYKAIRAAAAAMGPKIIMPNGNVVRGNGCGD